MDIFKEIIVNKILGVSFFNNFLFEGNGICVWCVFNVGFGRFLLYSEFEVVL